MLHHLFFEMRGEKKPNKVIALNWCCFCPDMTYPQGGRFDINQYLRTGADFVCLLLYSLVYLLLCGAHRQVSKPVFLFFYWQIPETISKPRNASTCVDYSKSSTRTKLEIIFSTPRYQCCDFERPFYFFFSWCICLVTNCKLLFLFSWYHIGKNNNNNNNKKTTTGKRKLQSNRLKYKTSHTPADSELSATNKQHYYHTLTVLRILQLS